MSMKIKNKSIIKALYIELWVIVMLIFNEPKSITSGSGIKISFNGWHSLWCSLSVNMHVNLIENLFINAGLFINQCQ